MCHRTVSGAKVWIKSRRALHYLFRKLELLKSNLRRCLHGLGAG